MYLILTGVLLASYLLFTRIRKRSSFPLPPGPPGYPFIGNLHELPHQYPWLAYADWAKQYGDVFSFKVFGGSTIVVNSAKAATELFEKRSTNYSDRPRLIMSDELMEWEWNFIHMPYTDRWRRHRRMFHQYFQPRNLSAYNPSQNKLTLELLDQFSRSPEDFAAHVRQYVGSIVLKAAYGYEVQAENDFYIKLVETAMGPLSVAVHGNYAVEFLPFLKHVPDWLPGAGFKRLAKDGAKKSRELRDIPFNAVKASMANGTAQQSFVCDNLEKARTAEDILDPKEEEDIVRNCAGIIYLAGSDTTASLLLAWMMAMAHYPDIQKRAQADVDEVVGKSRLPEFGDRSSLPYLEAMLLETMRWHAIVPLAAPHKAIEEDEYNGYRIPAGSTVIANTWAILHDEEVYPEPFKFKPERFLRNGEINFDSEPDPNFGFGYGRRICPGRYLALDSAWIAMASILATYDIGKLVNDNGAITEPRIFTDGLVSHPKPYQTQITPRSKDIYKLIETAKINNSS